MDWLQLSKNKGSGDAIIRIAALPNTGRENREGYLVFSSKNSNGATIKEETRKVVQAGADEFVSFNEHEITIGKEGANNIYIEGTSNSAYLQFGLNPPEGDFDIEGIDTYIVNNEEIESGKSPTGDPGKSNQYNFKLCVSIPANDTIETLSRRIAVKPASGFVDEINIKVSAGDPFFNVPEGDINITSSGIGPTLTIESNTSWTIQ